MKPQYHFVSSVLASTIGYIITDSIQFSSSIFISSFFIDLDHIVEYFYHKQFSKPSLKNFLKFFDDSKFKKIFLIFHSYELLFLIIFFYLRTYSQIILGIIIGSGLHLFMDIFAWRIHIYGYFLTYRIIAGFNPSRLFRKSHIYNLFC